MYNIVFIWQPSECCRHTETLGFILPRRMHMFLLAFSFISQFHDDVSSWDFHEAFNSGGKLREGTHARSHTLHKN